nr:hypothetical protein [Streptomyces sp. VRA16 Mangrove soil]
MTTTGLGDRLEELRRGRSRVLEKGHAVVLGWSDQVFTVVGEMVLSQAGLFGYDSVIALGPNAAPHRARSDDQLLLRLLNLRTVEEETGQALPVVAELTDHRSLALAPLGPEWDAVVYGELTALVMTRIA